MSNIEYSDSEDAKDYARLVHPPAVPNADAEYSDSEDEGLDGARTPKEQDRSEVSSFRFYPRNCYRCRPMKRIPLLDVGLSKKKQGPHGTAGKLQT